MTVFSDRSGNADARDHEGLFGDRLHNRNARDHE